MSDARPDRFARDLALGPDHSEVRGTDPLEPEAHRGGREVERMCQDGAQRLVLPGLRRRDGVGY